MAHETESLIVEDTTAQSASTPGSDAAPAEPIITVNNSEPAVGFVGADVTMNLIEQEHKLPSGSIGKVEKFCGLHVIEALTGGEGSSDRSEEATLWKLICATTTIDGVRISPEDIDEMDGRDVDFITAKFKDAIEGDGSEIALPENLPEPPKDHRWKAIPGGKLALIEKYKGRHVKEAQRQAQPDGSDYLPVLMSRMIKLGDNPTEMKGLFPEDFYQLDGLAFLSLMGEVASAMFPASASS